jgi:hypothetical protein
MMRIVLSNGVTLEPTAEQTQAIHNYLAHESNRIIVWDEDQQRMISRQRWLTADEWLMYHWRELMKGVLATAPPAAVQTIDAQIAELQRQKVAAMQPIVTPPTPAEVVER